MHRKLYPYLRKAHLVLGILVLGLLSCGDEYMLDDVDCSECYTPKPEYGPVTVSLTSNAENKRIPVKVFKGKYEERYLKDYSSAVVVDTVNDASSVTYDLPVNEYYSVEVEYMKDGKKVLVVDGDKLKMYKVSDNCDETCWIFRGGKIKAELKK
ncbi:MAG TPA: hypothetical protein VHO90_07350 [Bacteroidales bacterium]|nr:hypothetical protein [Bacteroidales bacterium]